MCSHPMPHNQVLVTADVSRQTYRNVMQHYAQRGMEIPGHSCSSSFSPC